jgi:hypothetical protein
MTKDRAATLTASVGAGLLFFTAGLHFQAYSSIVEQTPPALQPLMAALWVFCGVSVVIAALFTIAVTPLFIVRRRALLAIAALIPLSIAILQVVYIGFMTPTAILLLDTAVLLVAGEIGRTYQPRPVTVPLRS